MNDQLELDHLRELVLRFRKACEAVYERFPGGLCTEASLLLATYLRENGYGDFWLVDGKKTILNEGKKHDTGHSWLVKGEVFIDITGLLHGDFVDHIPTEAIGRRMCHRYKPF